jgi:16S rRNA (uracil1498-N3)-methyltransferase
MTGRPDPVPPRRRFYAAPEVMDGDPIVFAPRVAHHIARVLRLRPGACIAVFDGRREVDAELLVVGEAAVTATKTGAPRVAARPVDLILLQGVARGPRMDMIVRMMTEIGVSAVHPVLTERSVADPGPARLERWRRIAQEAARQCGRADVPAIHPPAALGGALAAAGPVDLLVAPWERASEPLGAVIADRAFVSAVFVIGPEGGLTAGEVEVVRGAGGAAVSLGPLVLRTETAGVVTAAMLLYERLLRSPRS